MKILIAYATTEGQTRKICRFAADRLADAGHAVELLQLGDAEGLDLARFDRAILAGSLHIGSYQKALTAFAKAEAAALAARPTLFLAVSLAAAGKDAEDWAGLNKCVADFQEETGWVPGRVVHVAGAFRFSEYDFFRAWAMRWIAHSKGETVESGRDKEYTDWAALGNVLDDWTKG